MNVTPIRGVFAPQQTIAFEQGEESINMAVASMQAAKVPQGYIVALLHAKALEETRRMIDD